jgi:hypothetical protein
MTGQPGTGWSASCTRPRTARISAPAREPLPDALQEFSCRLVVPEPGHRACPGQGGRRRGLVLVLGNSAVVDQLSADAEQSQVGADGCLAGECADVTG